MPAVTGHQRVWPVDFWAVVDPHHPGGGAVNHLFLILAKMDLGVLEPVQFPGVVMVGVAQKHVRHRFQRNWQTLQRSLCPIRFPEPPPQVVLLFLDEDPESDVHRHRHEQQQPRAEEQEDAGDGEEDSIAVDGVAAERVHALGGQVAFLERLIHCVRGGGPYGDADSHQEQTDRD